MSYQQKDNTGSLFKNDRKKQDTHADYRGSALLNGVEHWVDAWINTSNSGAKYMSLKFKPKEAQQSGSFSQQAAMRGSAFDDDSDTPF